MSHLGLVADNAAPDGEADKGFRALACAVVNRAVEDLKPDLHKRPLSLVQARTAAEFLLIHLWQRNNVWGAWITFMLPERAFRRRVWALLKVTAVGRRVLATDRRLVLYRSE